MDPQVVFGDIPSTSITGAFNAFQTAGASLKANCNASALNNIDLFGAKILNVDAVPLSNYAGTFNEYSWSDLNVCNITVSYTHPGRNDLINVNIMLPLSDWNGRFQGRGGGGFHTGYPSDAIAYPASEGYAVAQTDGGHTVYDDSAASWALDSTGNVNINLFQAYSYVALNDFAIIGKQVTENFYGKPPEYSYWNGCSTGGRQGLMLAQRYPDAYDGILAMAPAVNAVRFIVADYWPQHFMNRLGYYPPQCELNAITEYAIKACDKLDGVADGIISLPGLCDFDATSIVGKPYTCDGSSKSISAQAAAVANAAWTGPRSPSGRYDWFGLTKDTPLGALAGTTCTDNLDATTCKGTPFGIADEWIRLFVVKDPNFDIVGMTDEQYFDIFHKSIQEYESYLDTSDPDLSAFKQHGGKMITWHGLADQLIFPNGSSSYYERVRETVEDTPDFYRYFEAPGVFHCMGGNGPYPADAMEVLIRWVEEGEAPDTLFAASWTGDGTARRLCAWPKQQVYVGGDPRTPDSFACQ